MKPKTQVQKVPFPADTVYMIVAVEFGQRMPNGNCGYLGICSAEDASYPGSAPHPRRRRCRNAMAHVSVGESGNAIFLFPFALMLPCTARAFFNEPAFLIPADYTLPSHWQENLPRLQSFLLAAGQYPIEKTGAGFLIRF